MASAAPGPPPTPTSLLGLPKSWLLQLATTSALDGATLLALFRTCAFFRDAVAQHRQSHLTLDVPIAEERFQGEVDRLCTLARRSRSIGLRFTGLQVEDEMGEGPPVPWTETEPCITHLLRRAKTQLGGEQPLAGIKSIHLRVSRSSWLDPACISGPLLPASPAPNLPDGPSRGTCADP